MADTIRSRAALLALFTDNTSGDISAQDQRDFTVSAYEPQMIIPGGRLTLTTGVPVTTTDVTAATNIYYTPYLHNGIGLYDGTSWTLFTFSEITFALGTLSNNTNYDLFLYDNSGTLTLEATAWTNDTTRATALTPQDGVYVKSGATTRRYLGTFRTTSTTTTEDSAAKRFLWNAYNPVGRPMVAVDTTNSWTYSTNAFRIANGATAPTNCLQFILGLSGEIMTAEVTASVQGTSGRGLGCGIGLDSGTVNSALTRGGTIGANTVNGFAQLTSTYKGIPGVGYHYLSWLETGGAAGATTTWYGDNGASDFQSGIQGVVKA